LFAKRTAARLVHWLKLHLETNTVITIG
jgi:hypothetical protein